jgi:hypothetical protein
MKLPHIKNSSVAQQLAEAVFTNLYEMQIVPPKGIPFIEHLSDEITKIGGLGKIDELPETAVQKSRGHTRVHVKPYLDSTHLDLELTINLNAHGPNADQIVIYQMFKQWARKHRDERTGAMGLKIDSIGQAEISMFNKAGFIWRKVYCKTIMITEISAVDELSLDAGDPVTLTVKAVCEDWDYEDPGTL